MEGALRFVMSAEPKASELRRRVIFKLVPMMDPDGCANGRVRFNANGFDVNRHWDLVDPRDPQFARRMPEIWSMKGAIIDWVDSGRGVDLMLNLHNTESTEYLQAQVDDPRVLSRLQSFSDRLVATTTFAPSRPLSISSAPANTMTALWRERRIPVLLMEQRISSNEKLGRRPTVEDRLAFGRELIIAMAETVLNDRAGR
jgi:hypothetical protein